MEGDWLCYRGGHKCRENGYTTEVVTNGRMVTLQRWSSNGGRTEVVSYSGGRMVMLQR